MLLFKFHKDITRLMVFASLVLLSGCETAPTELDKNFGSSVRNLIEIQTAKPNDPGFGLDGQKTEPALSVYRTTAGDPKNVDKPK